MSDNNGVNVDLANSQQEINQLLSQISGIKDRAEAAAIAAEQASQKANSESAFAYNAKQNSEEHAKAISQVRGSVDADFNWLTTTKANADETAQAIGRAKVSAESDAQTLAKVSATAQQDASLIAVGREAAEKASPIIESYVRAFGPLWTRANEEATSVTQAKATVEARSATQTGRPSCQARPARPTPGARLDSVASLIKLSV